MAASQFGRQAHQRNPAEYKICKTEKELECGFPESPQVTERFGDKKMVTQTGVKGQELKPWS